MKTKAMSGDLGLVAAVAILGLVARFRFISEVFTPGHVIPFGPDSYFHLWRIEEAARTGLPPRFDPFINAPMGSHVVYPDGFDAVLGWIVRLLGGAHPSRFTVQVISMTLLPILGALVVVIAYLLARPFTQRAGALVAALLCAIVPQHIFISMFGRVDHHIIELGVPLLVILALVRSLDGQSLRRAGALGALLITALVYSATGAMLHVFAIIVVVWATGLREALRRNRHTVAFFSASAIAAAGAGLLLLPDALTRSGLAVDAPSRAPAILLLGSAAGCALLAFTARRGIKPLVITSIALLGVGFAVGLTLFGKGLAFVGRQGIVATIRESFPLFRDLEGAIGEHSLLIFALPLVSLQIMRGADPARFAIGALSLLGFILACDQARFAVVFMLPGAIAIGIVFDQIWQRPSKKRRLALVVGIVAALVPSALRFAKTHLVTRTTAAVYGASEWLEQATRPHRPRRTDTRADFSVASMWDDGNIIAYIGRTPVILGAMFCGDHERAVTDDLAILFGDHPERALRARKVRYLLLRSFSGDVERRYRALLDLSVAKRPPLARQLYALDGSAATPDTGQGYVPARGHWRLIYESPLIDPVTKRSIVKIFEHVTGARLHGRCLGAAPVFARIRVTTTMRRRFSFITASPCTSGSFSLRIPYAGEVDLAQGKHPLSHVTVDEATVQRGKVIDASP